MYDILSNVLFMPIGYLLYVYICVIFILHVYYFDNNKLFPLFGFYYVTTNGWIIDYCPFTNVILHLTIW